MENERRKKNNKKPIKGTQGMCRMKELCPDVILRKCAGVRDRTAGASSGRFGRNKGMF